MSSTKSPSDVNRLDLLSALIESAKTANPQALMVRLNIKDGTDYWRIVLNARNGRGRTFGAAASQILGPAVPSEAAADPVLVKLFDRLIDATRNHKGQFKWLILIMVGKGDDQSWSIVVGDEMGRARHFPKAARAALAGEHSHLIRVA